MRLPLLPLVIHTNPPSSRSYTVVLGAIKEAARSSELLTWGAGNLSAFWAFARGCDRVMHLQFRAGELGVSLVQVRAKRFEDSRSMRRTEWGQGDTKLLFRGFEISGIL